MQYRFWKETRVALLQNSPGQLSWLWIGCASPTCLGMFVEFHALNAFHASGLIPWIAVGGAFVVVDIDVEVVVLLVDVAVWHLSWFSRGILTGWQYWESVFPWNTTISNRNRKSFLHELKHPWAPSPCLVSCDSKYSYTHITYDPSLIQLTIKNTKDKIFCLIVSQNRGQCAFWCNWYRTSIPIEIELQRSNPQIIATVIY